MADDPRERACYTNHHLTSPKPPPIDHKARLPHPEPQQEGFTIEPPGLPEWIEEEAETAIDKGEA